ncbi:MAG: 3-deoxy-D-manno-octulosonic-acid transferase [Candidatus Azotimanducaceae bacterium]
MNYLSSYLALYLYRILLWLALPIVYVRLLLRTRREPAYAARRGERFGRVPVSINPGAIWFHTVSAGESIAAAPLISKMINSLPEQNFLVTTMTPTGSEQVLQRLGDSVDHCYAPYDFTFAVGNFLRTTQPRMLVLMETEIWPNLIMQAKAQDIPVLLINARMSERSARGYQRISWLSRPVLGAISHIACQSAEHMQRFVDLGVDAEKVSVLGSVKYDLQLPERLLKQASLLKAQLNLRTRPVWIAASTHSGEEEQIIEAHLLLRSKFPELCLLLVPRHPHRASDIGALIKGQNLSWRASSEGPTAGVYDVIVGDVMGQLLALYSLADVAFVGGSLIEHGGHNPIEPGLLGLPIVAGPADFNFAEVVSQLSDAGAYKKVVNADELAEVVGDLLADVAKREQMGSKALAVIKSSRGATQRTLALLSSQIAD